MNCTVLKYWMVSAMAIVAKAMLVIYSVLRNAADGTSAGRTYSPFSRYPALRTVWKSAVSPAWSVLERSRLI